MLLVKYVVTPMGNTNILKCDGGREMIMSYSELQNKRQRKSLILLGKLSQR